MLDDNAHSTQRSIESELSIIAQKVIVEIKKKHLNKIFLNDKIEINVINYCYAFVCNMKLINNNLFISTYAKDKFEHCYDAYSACIRLKNN